MTYSDKQEVIKFISDDTQTKYIHMGSLYISIQNVHQPYTCLMSYCLMLILFISMNFTLRENVHITYIDRQEDYHSTFQCYYKSLRCCQMKSHNLSDKRMLLLAAHSCNWCLFLSHVHSQVVPHSLQLKYKK